MIKLIISKKQIIAIIVWLLAVSYGGATTPGPEL